MEGGAQLSHPLLTHWHELAGPATALAGIEEPSQLAGVKADKMKGKKKDKKEEPLPAADAASKWAAKKARTEALDAAAQAAGVQVSRGENWAGAVLVWEQVGRGSAIVGSKWPECKCGRTPIHSQGEVDHTQ